MCVRTDLSIPSLVNGFARTPFMPLHVAVSPLLVHTVWHSKHVAYFIELTVLKVSIDLVRPNIRGHSDDRSRWTMLANIHGCRHAIETRHNNVHEHHIEMITADLADTSVCIRAV